MKPVRIYVTALILLLFVQNGLGQSGSLKLDHNYSAMLRENVPHLYLDSSLRDCTQDYVRTIRFLPDSSCLIVDHVSISSKTTGKVCETMSYRFTGRWSISADTITLSVVNDQHPQCPLIPAKLYVKGTGELSDRLTIVVDTGESKTEYTLGSFTLYKAE